MNATKASDLEIGSGIVACGTQCTGGTPFCDGTCQSRALDGGTCGAMLTV